jgi:hypothetical protein
VAISEGSYARGNPTRGTVDPSGYVDRSLNNPSQKRSGLAQAALERLRSNGANPMNGVTPPSPGVTPIGDIKQLSISPTGQMIPFNGLETPEVAPVPSPTTPSLDSMSNGATSGHPLAVAALSRLLASGGMQQ